MHARRGAAVLGGLILCLSLGARAGTEGDELLGTPAPPLDVAEWVQSAPLTLGQLHGTVVLLRFWTDTCPFCEASAPILADLHERYARQGLAVIGIYTPKPPRAVDRAFVARAAQVFGMNFPIGLDPSWETLTRYWLSESERDWTSVSFLIDRRGIIRFIHPGGSYSREDAAALEEMIIRLLARTG